jgi:hypothetical protein
MKKLVLVLLIASCISATSFSQTFEWAKTGPVSTSSKMVRDGFGDLYISMGAYLLKFNSAGNLQWQQTLTGFFIEGIVTDSAGNIFVGGEFNGTKSIGPYTVTANTSSFCVFLTKFDSSGSVQWLEQSYDNASTVMDDISIDNYGNPVIIGRFQDSLQLGSYTFDAPATNQVFLAKYSTNGGCLWAKHIVAGSFGGGLPGPKLKNDMYGNVYIAGQYFSWQQFDTVSAAAVSGFTDGFVVKYDINGNFIWLNCFGGIGNQPVYSFDIDDNGNSYLSGYYDDTYCTFGSYTLTGSSAPDYYTASYDPNGNFRWANSQFSPLITACDSGFYANTSYLTKYDTTGMPVWNKYVGGATLSSIILVGNNDIYVSGSFSGTVAFDTITLSASSTTLYLGKIGPSALTTNIPEAAEIALEVYPNPTRNTLFYKMEGHGPCRLQLYALTGQLLYEEELNPSSGTYTGELDLGNYSKGLYYLRVSDQEGSTYKPVILD